MTYPITETAPLLDLRPGDIAGLWQELQAYHALFSPLFRRREQRERSLDYLHGLLLELPRKSIEPLVLALKGPQAKEVRAMQQLLGKGAWEDAALLRRHWQEVEATLGEADGVLILDGSDFPKQGQASVGVKRQYCGQVGKRANCQAGVFLGYASRRGYTLLDRRLYLPREWLTEAAYAERRRRCRLPTAVAFQTKPQLGQAMLRAVVEAGTLRARWVTADAAFGADTTLLDDIDALGLWYFVEVALDTRVWPQRPATYCPVSRRRQRTHPRLVAGEPAPVCLNTLAATLDPAGWTRHTIKEGSQGPLLADLAWRRVVARRHTRPGPEVWVVLRRHPLSGELKAYLSNAPATVPAAELVRLSGMRWPIETCFEDSKQYLGLGDYETRTWIGWHHHMTLCLLAHHFLVKLQQRLKKNAGPHPAPGEPTVGRAAPQAIALPGGRPGPAGVLAASQPGRLPLTPPPPSGAAGDYR